MFVCVTTSPRFVLLLVNSHMFCLTSLRIIPLLAFLICKYSTPEILFCFVLFSIKLCQQLFYIHVVQFVFSCITKRYADGRYSLEHVTVHREGRE